MKIQKETTGGLDPIVVCPYCVALAVLVTGKDIYQHRPDLYDQNFWRCPRCGAYVGCHKRNHKLGFKGNEPLGRLADAELRAAKHAAHQLFDPLWNPKEASRRWRTAPRMSRHAAYSWLAGQLGIKVEECHIGMFDLETCMRVMEISKRALPVTD